MVISASVTHLATFHIKLPHTDIKPTKADPDVVARGKQTIVEVSDFDAGAVDDDASAVEIVFFV